MLLCHQPCHLIARASRIPEVVRPHPDRGESIGVLKKLLSILTRDLTGQTWVVESEHPYFGNLVYFGHKDGSKAYWEAEVPIDEGPGKVSVTMPGTPDGPTPAEEAFCRQALSDLDRLFELCRGVFEDVYETWASQRMPTEWRDTFDLEGLSIPNGGELSRDWEITYFVRPANHWFTARIVDGRAASAYVDG